MIFKHYFNFVSVQFYCFEMKICLQEIRQQKHVCIFSGDKACLWNEVQGWNPQARNFERALTQYIVLTLGRLFWERVSYCIFLGMTLWRQFWYCRSLSNQPFFFHCVLQQFESCFLRESWVSYIMREREGENIAETLNEPSSSCMQPQKRTYVCCCTATRCATRKSQRLLLLLPAFFFFVK